MAVGNMNMPATMVAPPNMVNGQYAAYMPQVPNAVRVNTAMLPNQHIIQQVPNGATPAEKALIEAEVTDKISPIANFAATLDAHVANATWMC